MIRQYVRFGAIALLLSLGFTACNKVEHISSEESPKQLISEELEIDDEITSELLEHSEIIQAVSEDGNTSINLLISSNNLDLINYYRDSLDFTFDIHDKESYLADLIFPDEEVDGEETGEEDIDPNEYIKIFVLDKPISTTQLVLFKSGLRYGSASSSTAFAKVEDWSDLGTIAVVNWTYTANASNDLRVKVKYKNCGWCSKYTLADNVFLGSYDTYRVFSKSTAKRMYVTVWSNWYNRTVVIY